MLKYTRVMEWKPFLMVLTRKHRAFVFHNLLLPKRGTFLNSHYSPSLTLGSPALFPSNQHLHLVPFGKLPHGLLHKQSFRMWSIVSALLHRCVATWLSSATRST
mmetsp:Transcript_15818/g.46958  ORF Transcript_15818/g.46958 Transcript_15818/m.46958 type:complete len:104 (-) Transcript_15818:698-1009(-)